jgi:hypothetical protein
MNVLRSGHAGASLLGALIVVGGCTGTLAAPETTASGTAEPPTCVVDQLVVSADRDGVRVRNPLARPCQFSGRYPVTMLVWHLIGAGPPVAAGALPGGSTYVQPYIAQSGNNCPPTSEQFGAVTVYVEGIAVRVPQQGQLAHEIAHCTSFTAGTPRTER